MLFALIRVSRWIWRFDEVPETQYRHQDQNVDNLQEMRIPGEGDHDSEAMAITVPK